MTKDKFEGFTLIELVVVVVLLAVLAAVALPKYMNFTKEARTAVVESTGGALSSGLNLAHAKWQVNNTAEFADLTGEGQTEVGFSKSGWPNRISVDGQTLLAHIADGGISGNDACGQIIKSVMNTTGISFIPADENGKCASGDFCAIAENKTDCVYIYRQTNEKIRYKSDTGMVIIE